MSMKMPDGTITDSVGVYLEAWHELAKPLEETYGWKLLSFNPGFQFDLGSSALTLDTAVVRTLSEYVVKHTELRKAAVKDADEHKHSWRKQGTGAAGVYYRYFCMKCENQHLTLVGYGGGGEEFEVWEDGSIKRVDAEK